MHKLSSIASLTDGPNGASAGRSLPGRSSIFRSRFRPSLAWLYACYVYIHMNINVYAIYIYIYMYIHTRI